MVVFSVCLQWIIFCRISGGCLVMWLFSAPVVHTNLSVLFQHVLLCDCQDLKLLTLMDIIFRFQWFQTFQLQGKLTSCLKILQWFKGKLFQLFIIAMWVVYANDTKSIEVRSRQSCPSPAQIKLKKEAVLIKYDVTALLKLFSETYFSAPFSFNREVCEQEAAARLFLVMWKRRLTKLQPKLWN